MKLPWYVWLLGAVALSVGVYFAVRQWGVVGTLVAPGAIVVAAAGEVIRTAGGKPVSKNESGRPRRPGTSAVSPKPAEGEKRSRPRRNNWR